MTEQERFWAKVSKSEECWLWTAAQAPNGYGTFFVGPGAKKAVRAHRYSWSLHFGPIPEGRIICHRCDVRLCVRPDHLFLGSSRDNNVDTLLKDRNAQALPREKVAAIMNSSGSTWEVAEAFNVSQRTTWRIQQARLFAERAGWLSPSDSKAMLEELKKIRQIFGDYDYTPTSFAECQYVWNQVRNGQIQAEKERDELKAQLELANMAYDTTRRVNENLSSQNSQLQARIKEFEEDRMSHGPCHMIHVEERDAEISQLQAQVAALVQAWAAVEPKIRQHGEGFHRTYDTWYSLFADMVEAAKAPDDAAKAYEAKIRAEEREVCVRVATEALCLEGADCKELLCEAARVTIAIRTLGDAQK